ncbi:hypothetical protein ACIKTA_04360 [Hansschlegelia beijingensis]
MELTQSNITVSNTYFFNPNLTPTSQAMRSLVEQVAQEVFDYESLRKDRRKKAEEALGIILCNLAMMASLAKTEMVIQLNVRAMDLGVRYTPTIITYKRMKFVIDSLQEREVVSVSKGGTRRIETIDWYDNPVWVQEATRVGLLKLHDQLSRLGTIEDIRHRASDELVILRDNKQLVSYEETSLTTRMRQELVVLNEHIGRHPVSYLGSNPVDPFAVTLRRHFSDGSFRSGGRLFGHWAQNLPKTERHLLRIDGERVVDLDFGSMHVSLLHAWDGRVMPECDPFIIPGFESHRDFVKKASYCIINSKKPLKRCPEGLRGDLPKGVRWKDLEPAILEHVPLVAQYAYTGAGLRLMRDESDILVSVLLGLAEAGIGFIPMHDGLMVPESQVAYAEHLMIDAYANHTGQPVRIKRTSYPDPATTPEHELQSAA